MDDVHGGLQTGGEENTDLANTLLINGVTFTCGIIWWFIFDLAGWSCGLEDRTRRTTCERFWCVGPGPVELNTVALNYIMYLEECRNLFVVQTILCACFTIPIAWNLGPDAIGFFGRTLRTAGTLGSTGLAELCIDTFVRGLFALAFVEKLRRGTRRAQMRAKEKSAISRTLWLTGLPTKDRAKNRRFEFYDKDFRRVEHDLKEALQHELNKDVLGLPAATHIHVHVAPVVDEWQRISERYFASQEMLAAYKIVIRQNKWESKGNMFSKWMYMRELSRLSAEVVRLETDFHMADNATKGLSGSAFVTFEKAYHCDNFLKEKPRWWHCRQYAYFTFGHPPFSSVTLACTRAPHPTDVNWLNLHITPLSQFLRGAVTGVALLFVMTTLVAPVTITSQLNVILPAMKKHFAVVEEALHARHIALGHSIESWYGVTQQLPGIILVFINSVMLPYAINRIAIFMRLHRYSSMEVIQLHGNYIFLLLTSLVMPFLGLTGIRGLIVYINRQVVGVPVMELLGMFSEKLLQSSGVFAARYILNSACLTNTNSLLQIAQRVYRIYASRTARTISEAAEARKQWAFAWGYWYAWTISMFTLGLVLSSIVPSTLPCAALFFCFQHFVDGHNLAHGVYAQGAESGHIMITRVLHWMRCIIAAWWIIMGTAFELLMRNGLQDQWDSWISAKATKNIIRMQVVFAFVLMVWSWWDQQSILHDSNFEDIDVSKRGMSRRGLCSFLDPFVNRINSLWTGDDQYLRVGMSDAETGLDDCNRIPDSMIPFAASPVDREVSTEPSDCQQSCHSESGNPFAGVSVPTFSHDLAWDARTVIIRSQNNPF